MQDKCQPHLRCKSRCSNCKYFSCQIEGHSNFKCTAESHNQDKKINITYFENWSGIACGYYLHVYVLIF